MKRDARYSGLTSNKPKITVFHCFMDGVVPVVACFDAPVLPHVNNSAALYLPSIVTSSSLNASSLCGNPLPVGCCKATSGPGRLETKKASHKEPERFPVVEFSCGGSLGCAIVADVAR